MAPDHAILLPAIAMVLLTAIVWVRMYSVRLAEIRDKRIHPQKLAGAKQAAELLQNTQPADHLKNLFEMPVLFYALCAFVAITHQATVVMLACAWGYVVLRSLHAFIHLTSNKVIRRFQAYVASCIVLFAMWGVFAVRLITA